MPTVQPPKRGETFQHRTIDRTQDNKQKTKNNKLEQKPSQIEQTRVLIEELGI